MTTYWPNGCLRAHPAFDGVVCLREHYAEQSHGATVEGSAVFWRDDPGAEPVALGPAGSQDCAGGTMAAPRISWDEYFFSIARAVSTRATCPRASIGAVLVKDRRIVGTGFNGAPSGQEHCPTTPEHMALVTCDRSVHAEVNCLRNTTTFPFGATLYVVGPRVVCPNCAERLREHGVTDIRWRES